VRHGAIRSSALAPAELNIVTAESPDKVSPLGRGRTSRLREAALTGARRTNSPLSAKTRTGNPHAPPAAPKALPGHVGADAHSTPTAHRTESAPQRQLGRAGCKWGHPRRLDPEALRISRKGARCVRVASRRPLHLSLARDSGATYWGMARIERLSPSRQRLVPRVTRWQANPFLSRSLAEPAW
jgi:hypothetical protein